MREIMKIAKTTLRNKRKMNRLIAIQMFVMFLLVFLLVGLLVENKTEMKLLQEQIGSSTWKIQPTIDSSTSTSEDWTDKQLNWLEEKFPKKVGLVYVVTKAEETQGIYVNEPIKRLLFKNGAGDSKEILKYLVPKKMLHENAEILDGKPTIDISPFLYIVETGDKEIIIRQLAKQLSDMNAEFNYEISQVIAAKEQLTEINLIYIKSILFFTILSFILIATGVISFVVLQHQHQAVKFRLFRLFGATLKDLLKIYLLINVRLIGPSFVIALICFSLISILLLTLVAWLYASIIGLIVVVILLLAMTLPILSLNDNVSVSR